MILSTVDFRFYKKQLQNEFENDFHSIDMFESYIKEQLETQNIKSFLYDLVGMENIILGNSPNNRTRGYTEVELILKANVSKNLSYLLEWKNEKQVSAYSENINKEKLELIEKLEKVFTSQNPNFSDKLLIDKSPVQSISENVSPSQNIQEQKKNGSVLLIGIGVIAMIILLKLGGNKDSAKSNHTIDINTTELDNSSTKDVRHDENETNITVVDSKNSHMGKKDANKSSSESVNQLFDKNAIKKNTGRDTTLKSGKKVANNNIQTSKVDIDKNSTKELNKTTKQNTTEEANDITKKIYKNLQNNH